MAEKSTAAALFSRSKPEMATNEDLYGWAKELVDLTLQYPQYRRYGTEGDNAATNWIADKFRSFGIENVEQQYYDVNIQQYDDYHLFVNNEEIPSFFMHGATFTKPEGLDAELVYLGDHVDPNEDYTGKIVLVDLPSQDRLPTTAIAKFGTFVYDPEEFFNDQHSISAGVPRNFPVSYYSAADRGAAGFIGIWCDWLSGSAKVYPDPTFRVQPRIPGMFVGKYEGEKLVERLKNGEKLTANMILQGEAKTTKTNNVVAILPGQKKETILVSTHHDCGFAGAVQDGSGVVTLLGIAKYFSKIPSNFRQKTLVFVADSAHYDFNYPMGANKFLEMNPEIFKNIVLTVGVEHIAAYCEETKEGFIPAGGPEPRYIFAPPNKMIQQICASAIASNNMVRTVIPPCGAVNFLGENQSYFLRNYPSISMMSGPKYLFSEDDTLDKLPKEHLQSAMATFISIIDKCMYLPPVWISNIDM